MKVNILSEGFLNSLTIKSKKSDRGRQHLNIHDNYSDPCQRLMNVIQPNSYIPPHRHSLDPRHETMIAIRGVFALITFSSDGKNKNKIYFGTERYSSIPNVAIGVEIPPKTWHTVIALVPDSALFETKAGPFDPNKPKELAQWAPDECSDEASNFFKMLNIYAHEGVSI